MDARAIRKGFDEIFAKVVLNKHVPNKPSPFSFSEVEVAAVSEPNKPEASEGASKPIFSLSPSQPSNIPDDSGHSFSDLETEAEHQPAVLPSVSLKIPLLAFYPKKTLKKDVKAQKKQKKPMSKYMLNKLSTIEVDTSRTVIDGIILTESSEPILPRPVDLNNPLNESPSFDEHSFNDDEDQVERQDYRPPIVNADSDRRLVIRLPQRQSAQVACGVMRAMIDDRKSIRSKPKTQIKKPESSPPVSSPAQPRARYVHRVEVLVWPQYRSDAYLKRQQHAQRMRIAQSTSLQRGVVVLSRPIPGTSSLNLDRLWMLHQKNQQKPDNKPSFQRKLFLPRTRRRSHPPPPPPAPVATAAAVLAIDNNNKMHKSIPLASSQNASLPSFNPKRAPRGSIVMDQ